MSSAHRIHYCFGVVNCGKKSSSIYWRWSSSWHVGTIEDALSLLIPPHAPRLISLKLRVKEGNKAIHRA